MHVHIASVSHATDGKGAVFKVFNIYLSGTYHCSLRYSQLLDLHNEVEKQFDFTTAIPFPPKRLRITTEQLEERRRQLERYLHYLLQHPEIGVSGYLLEYMLVAQQASSGVRDTSVGLPIYLCNGRNMTVPCSAFDRHSTVLETACQGIGLESEMIYYFTLMLEHCSHNNQTNWILLRALHECEAPYLSLRSANTMSEVTYRLALRRWFFDPEWNIPLLSSRVGLDLLYIEAVRDVESGDLDLSQDIKQKLGQLRKFGKRKEYIQLASRHPHYGYRKCKGIFVQGGQEGFARIGGKEIIISHQISDHSYMVKCFPITTLCSWKVGVLRDVKEHFLALEHEYSPDRFKWVWLRGESTILLTMCLGQAVKEFRIRRKNEAQRMPGDSLYSLPQKPSLPFLKFTSVRPPGDDLHMSVADAMVTLNGFDTDSRASAENGEDEPDLDIDPSEGHSPPESEIMTGDKQESSALDSASSSSSSSSLAAGGQMNYMRSKIGALRTKGAGLFKQKSQQDYYFNPTILGDEDL